MKRYFGFLTSLITISCLVVFSACSSSSEGPADGGGVGDGGDGGVLGKAGDWTWLAVSGAKCRDGSGAGFVSRTVPGSDKLVIFLQGGGACFDSSTCADNPSHFGQSDADAFAAADGKKGIFNPGRAENPVKDWNFVFVPYCTGDLHAGSAVDASALGVTEKQQFVGYQNIKKYLPKIKAMFPNMSRILLGGESAGGFGTGLNYPQVAKYFSGIPVSMLDDAGPLFASDAALAPCLQSMVNLLWDAAPAIADGCTDCIQPSGDGFSGWYTWIASHYPQGTFGLFSAMEDGTIREFFGNGSGDCLDPAKIPASVYSQALLDLRDNLLVPTGRWSTYYIPGTTHTITWDEDRYYSTKVGDKLFTTWVGELLKGVPSPVGP